MKGHIVLKNLKIKAYMDKRKQKFLCSYQRGDFIYSFNETTLKKIFKHLAEEVY